MPSWVCAEFLSNRLFGVTHCMTPAYAAQAGNGMERTGDKCLKNRNYNRQDKEFASPDLAFSRLERPQPMAGSLHEDATWRRKNYSTGSRVWRRKSRVMGTA